MTKARNTFEAQAAEAARRLDKVRASGEQLSFLPDEGGRTPEEAGTGQPGRPKGAMGKGSSQLRQWLAARGYRMPEEQLAEIAGLASGEGVMMHALTQAERLLAWAFDEAKDVDGKARTASPEQRLSAFMTCYAAALRASEALLPYGTPKAAPEGEQRAAVQIIMPQAAPAAPRDVTPRARSLGHMVPADVAYEIEQKQEVSSAENGDADSEDRTNDSSD
ncbi:hypothetical protein CDO87_03485 [Sagittula sp. P11]|uniref:hypothetical protein n=1 Tax=Sagittula sp. P11 TaxID=2009329 RepID=UPI000C2D2464|nr:hypothetical protein [Sagittula sp. P11]AUC52306.1 hypothetical protein CDO87_03485 [Sagittula sp. P11]